MNPTDCTIPEAPETIEAQLEWLKEGKRKAVLLTPGCVLPDLWHAKIEVTVIEQGLLAFNTDRISEHEVQFLVRNDCLGELLGYGIASKPKTNGRAGAPSPAAPVECDGPRGATGPTSVVVIRSANGHEKQAVVASSERLDEVKQFAQRLAGPEDTVTLEDGRRVVIDRLKSLDRHELKVRPVDLEQDMPELLRSAAADQHAVRYPTLIIERGGEIVGYIGMNSLPLYRLWFHSQKLKASDSLRLLFLIENHYRMTGAPIVATLINTHSPFYPVARRGGYLESPDARLFLKDL